MSKKVKKRCNHCGKCCKECKWLIRYVNGKTRCSIYHMRLGAFTNDDQTQFCNLRENEPVNYPGCPYNKKEWPYAVD